MLKIKLLLLVPPNKDGWIRDVQYGCWHKPKFLDYSWPPITLYYCSALVQDSVVIDGKVEDASVSRVASFNPEYVMIGTGSLFFEDDLAYLKKLKKALPETKVILFGELPDLDSVLSHEEIDFVIKGEAEAVVKDLVDGKFPKGVCKKGNLSTSSVNVEDLNNLPFPSIPVEKLKLYRNYLGLYHPFATIIASRGCPFPCSFCTAPLFYGTTYRVRKPENVFEEIKAYYLKGVKEFFFRDENLTLKKSFLHDLCGLIEKSNLKIKWICNSRVDTVDEKLLINMKKAGCHLIKFGCESGSDETLKILKKKITTMQIRDTFELCKRLGIGTLAHFMIGNPGESKEDIEHTLVFAHEIKPTYASFDVLITYNGAGIEKEQPSSLSPEELDYYHNQLFKGFYMNPRVILRNALSTRSIKQFKDKAFGTYELWKGVLQ